MKIEITGLRAPSFYNSLSLVLHAVDITESEVSQPTTLTKVRFGHTVTDDDGVGHMLEFYTDIPSLRIDRELKSQEYLGKFEGKSFTTGNLKSEIKRYFNHRYSTSPPQLPPGKTPTTAYLDEMRKYCLTLSYALECILGCLIKQFDQDPELSICFRTRCIQIFADAITDKTQKLHKNEQELLRLSENLTSRLRQLSLYQEPTNNYFDVQAYIENYKKNNFDALLEELKKTQAASISLHKLIEEQAKQFGISLKDDITSLDPARVYNALIASAIDDDEKTRSGAALTTLICSQLETMKSGAIIKKHTGFSANKRDEGSAAIDKFCASLADEEILNCYLTSTDPQNKPLMLCALLNKLVRQTSQLFMQSTTIHVPIPKNAQEQLMRTKPSVKRITDTLLSPQTPALTSPTTEEGNVESLKMLLRDNAHLDNLWCDLTNLLEKLPYRVAQEGAMSSANANQNADLIESLTSPTNHDLETWRGEWAGEKNSLYGSGNHSSSTCTVITEPPKPANSIRERIEKQITELSQSGNFEQIIATLVARFKDVFTQLRPELVSQAQEEQRSVGYNFFSER